MPADLTPGRLAQLACLLEATARKPGNVHRFIDFDDANYLDFVLSALAIGPPFDLAPTAGVGEAVLAAVRATRRLVAGNTNLGMILLLAPLAAVPAAVPLPNGVREVLASTTVADAGFVYEAIRASRPGGLGSAAEQDVRGEPTVTLLEAMRLASGRDSVARQYVTGFADVFGLALPALASGLLKGWPLETAIVGTHLALMSSLGDTLIARKRGAAEAEEARRLAAEVVRAGWPEAAGAGHALDALDTYLRAEGHGRNPGTTADLVAAALFAALRDDTIAFPLTGGPAGWSGLGF